MRKFFEPPGLVGEEGGRLRAILRSIREGLADPFDWPIRLWKVATASLPTFDEAKHEGAIAYDSTLDRITYGNHTAWVTLMPYDAGIADLAALTPAQGDLIYGDAPDSYALLSKDTNATRYLSNTGTNNNPAWAQVNLTNGVTGTLPVGNGGIGVATITGLMQGNGTSAVTAVTNSTTVGQVLRVTGSNTYAWGALDLADTDAITGDLPFANLAQGTGLSVLGVTGSSTADNASIVAASDFQVMRRSGSAVAFGSVNLASSNAVTGILPVANSDTGTSGAKLPLLNGANTWSGSQVFTVDAISINISGNKTLAAWTVGGGVGLEIASNTYTDNFSAASSTITNRYAHRFGTPTFAATNATVTITTAITFEIGGPPTTGTGVAITTKYTFQCTAGNMNMQAGDYYRGGTKVLGARATGWAADSSTAKRTGNAAYNAVTLTTPPTQAELQAMSTALTNAMQTIRALKDDLITHGVIGA